MGGKEEGKGRKRQKERADKIVKREQGLYMWEGRKREIAERGKRAERKGGEKIEKRRG